MASPSPKQRIVDAVTDIRQARGYVAGIDRDAFERNDLIQDAVLRRLQNASEAITRLKQEHPAEYDRLETDYPEVNWRRFRDLANRYRHDYDVIDTDLVWQDLSSSGITEDVVAALGPECAFLDEQ